MLLDIHAASMSLSAAEFEQYALGAVRKVIDFDFAIWGAGDGLSRELHRVRVIDQTDDLFTTWEPVKEDDPFANLVIGNTGHTWTTDQIPGFHDAQAYREHWGLYQARSMMATMQIDPVTGLHVFLNLARDRTHTPFSETESRFKNLVTQHLFLAARHNDQYQLSHQDAAMALLDYRGVVHAGSALFRERVCQEWGKRAAQRLPENVNRNLWSQGRYRSRHLALEAEPAGSRLLVRVRFEPPLVLSPREREIAMAYAQGESYKEVARRLGVSPNTVRSHLSRIYQKLDVRDKGALAMWLNEHA